MKILREDPKTFDDKFTICTKLHENGVVMEFAIYQIVGSYGDGTPIYDDCNCGAELFENAVPIITGDLKWDGCCNFDFTEQVEEKYKCMLHICGRDGFNDWSKAMGYVYDIGMEKMPDNKEYLI